MNNQLFTLLTDSALDESQRLELISLIKNLESTIIVDEIDGYGRVKKKRYEPVSIVDDTNQMWNELKTDLSAKRAREGGVGDYWLMAHETYTKALCVLLSNTRLAFGAPKHEIEDMINEAIRIYFREQGVPLNERLESLLSD